MTKLFYLEEIDNLDETGISRCIYCKKNFVNAIDNITKKISKYLWKPDCECVSKDLRVSIG